MRRLHIIIVTVFIFSFFFISCYYDSEEVLYPSVNCDTTFVSFSNTIAPMISSNCKCHSNLYAADKANNIRLEDFKDVVAKHEAITGSIKHTGLYLPMPKDRAKIKDCSIRQFEIWVDNGMPSN